jgi:hypothetical protein
MVRGKVGDVRRSHGPMGHLSLLKAIRATRSETPPVKYAKKKSSR